MGIDRRNYALYEEDLIDMFRLCPNEEVEKLEVWFDKQSKQWNIDAVITDSTYDEDGK